MVWIIAWIARIMLGSKPESEPPPWKYIGDNKERERVPKWVQEFADSADVGGWPREFELKGKTFMYQVYAGYDELTGRRVWTANRRKRVAADRTKPRTTVYL